MVISLMWLGLVVAIVVKRRSHEGSESEGKGGFSEKIKSRGDRGGFSEKSREWVLGM